MKFNQGLDRVTCLRKKSFFGSNQTCSSLISIIDAKLPSVEVRHAPTREAKGKSFVTKDVLVSLW